MKKTLSALLFLGSISAFAAAKPVDLAANKRLVRDFYELAFTAHKPTDAAKKYIGDTYTQHNPFVPDGAVAFYEYFEGVFQKNPKARSTIKRIVAEGDLVILHVHSQENEADRGNAIVDIFRVANGKIVEHWDVNQEVPATSANTNTMF